MSSPCVATLSSSRIEHWAKLGREAMLREVMLTPKPGLVDLKNNGSHDDMGVETFYLSIEAITPWLHRFVEVGIRSAHEEPMETFYHLRLLGQSCEKEMFEATQGINTHKGMIFSQAIILGAAGRVIGCDMVLTSQLLQETIRQICTDLVAKDFTCKQPPLTAGERFYIQTKDGGIRAEAQKGYPTLFSLALPNFQQWKRLYGEEIAMKKTLLLLMSHLNDTTLWSRGGLEGLRWGQQKAKNALNVPIEALENELTVLDESFISRRLSPGGSADLLAMTWLLDRLLF